MQAAQKELHWRLLLDEARRLAATQAQSQRQQYEAAMQVGMDGCLGRGGGSFPESRGESRAHNGREGRAGHACVPCPEVRQVHRVLTTPTPQPRLQAKNQELAGFKGELEALLAAAQALQHG